MLATYLDYNASAPLRPEARDAMLSVMEAPANPSSVHGFGQQARLKVEDARASVAGLAGAKPEEIIFTSGGTEANAMALMRDWPCVFVGATEHAAVLESAPDAIRLTVDHNGVIDLDALEDALSKAPKGSLVSVMAANNETGVIQPLDDIITLARRYGMLVHSDAVQAFGKIIIDFDALGLDLMSVSAHKLGGPTGVGALIQREGIPANPRTRGGGQERNRRPGTENVPGILGFGAAAAVSDASDFNTHCLPMRDDFERRIKADVPDAVVLSCGVPRLANTTCLALPGRHAETQVMALDLAGIAVSAGAACSSGKVKASHVLTAMGADNLATSAIRISSGWNSTKGDVERLAEAYINLYKQS